MKNGVSTNVIIDMSVIERSAVRICQILHPEGTIFDTSIL